MKRIVCFLLCFLFLAVLSVSPASAEETEKSVKKSDVVLNVYNWGEYIEPTVNDIFEKETGITVNYKNFTDNESMYAVLASGAAVYDIIIPSDYMVGKLIQSNMLAKLNLNNIPNYSLIDEKLKNQPYDPENEYSVPYTWGTVGIFYNTKYVDEADLALGWNLLWDEKYKGRIFNFDNPRDAFGIALIKNGLSANSTNPNDWDIAYQDLLRQKPVLQQYVMDQIYDKMINEEGWIAPYYAGDGIIMMDEDEGNPDIDFFVPNEGTNLFIDALCVPVNSPHKTEAEMYINFMCRTDIALANAEYIGYSTPQKEARQQLDPEIAENENFYPTEELLAKTQVYLTLPEESNTYMDRLWMKLKLPDDRWAICLVVVGLLAAVCLIAYLVRLIRKRCS